MRIKINNLLSTCMLLVMMLGVSSYALAQRTISGTVTDDSGEPVISATVQVKGTTVGTTTDIDGKYSIKVPEGSNVLIFSYIGYATQEVGLTASNSLDVVMREDVAVIDEVVVVGYGTQTRKEVTSAVQSVKAEDFNQGNVQDPVQLVQGKVAGLAISKVGGDPNGGSTIRLRGLSTLGANTQPLVVIDGVIGGSLNAVDPNDIESIDILKDGSAAAIYGTRASSGVIIITTKKGAAGKTTVNYNGYVTSEGVARTVPVTSAAEFRQFNTADDQGANTNWVDLVTDNAFQHVHNISLSGGTGKTTYRASFNFRDIDGVAIGTNFQQLNGRLNLSQKALNDRLTFDLNVSATDRTAKFGFTEAQRYAVLYNPTAPVYITDENDPLFDKYGGYYQAENFDYFNPLAIAEQGINDGSFKTLLISGKATLEIMEGLTASAFVSTQKNANFFGSHYSKQAYFRGFGRNGLANIYTENNTSNLFEATANYNKKFGDSKLSVLVGYSYNENINSHFGANAGNFLSDDIGYNNIEDAQDIPNGLASVYSNRESNRVIGFFSRVNYSFDDTYFLSATVRREGASRFGADNKWGLFPAVSGSVTLSNLFEAPSVDNLKLRVGYGETGAIPPESYLSLFRFNTGSAFFFNGGYVPAYGPSRNDNPNLKWEVKGEFNAGLDFAFMDYKLTGTIDYYSRVTRDLIYNIAVSVPPNQASNTWANLEDIELANSGVELTLTYNFSSGEDFTWEPTVTFGTYNTVLNRVDAPEDSEFKFFQNEEGSFLDFSTSPGAPGLNNDPSAIVLANQELGQLWGLVYEGVDDQGNFIFTDTDGDGVITPDDKQVIGNGLPDFSLGFQNTFKYKNLDFSFFLRGDFGHDLANMYRTFYEPLTPSRTMENIVKTQYFDENLTDASQFSSHYVEDASYMVLDNMTIGYRFPTAEGSGVSNVRVYLTGRNLFWITNYSGVDPQPRFNDTGATDNGSESFASNPLAPGIDRRNVYFATRSLTFGLNLDF